VSRQADPSDSVDDPGKPARLAFMGTPEFAVPVLAALLDAGHDVRVVYTQPPRPAGRGKRERKSPVHDFADARGIEVLTPERLRDAAEQRAFAALDLDAAVVVAYGIILPREILDAPRHGCVNVHASLLPRWRGAAPIQRAIMAGDTETGISIMAMDEGLDTGPVLLTERVAITGATTGASLHDALAGIGARLIVPALVGLLDGSLAAEAQGEAGITYASKLTRDIGRLNWTLPAVALERLVRALDPWPGAWCLTGGERLKVLGAEVVDLGKLTNPPGTVLDPALTVACGDGALRLTRVQKPGKGAMAADAYLRGNPVAPGAVVE
jgi:methionyl-tRNA formyltransferase